MMRPRSAYRQLLVAIFISALAAAGCERVSSDVTDSSRQPAVATGACTPARVLVLQDQTGSRRRTLTPVLGVDDLQRLIDLLLRCGGEFRIGEVRDTRPAAFVALRIEAPPAEVTDPGEWPANPFLRAEAKQALKRAQQNAERMHESWRKESERRIEEFEVAIATRWEGASLANRTDVWAALERASLFLREPESGFRTPMRRWLIAITDGEQTAPRPDRPLELDPSATLVLVNAGGHQGDLAELKPERFESLPAAIRWVVEQSTRAPKQERASDVRPQSQGR